MKISVLGARGSVPVSGPQYQQYGGDTTCLLVTTDSEKKFIVDAGTGLRSLNNIIDREFSLLLTHTHWDHIQGLPFFRPAYDPARKIHIYGCDTNGGIKKALENQHYGANFPVPFSGLRGIKEISDFAAGEKIYDDGNLQIETLLQNHPLFGSVAYRFTERKAGGQAVRAILSSDFEPDDNGYDDRLIEFWNKADLVIADTQFEPKDSELKVNPFMKGWGHSDFKTGIRLATLAEAQEFAGTHHDPSSTDEYLQQMERRMRREAENAAVQFQKDWIRTGLTQPNASYLL